MLGNFISGIGKNKWLNDPHVSSQKLLPNSSKIKMASSPTLLPNHWPHCLSYTCSKHPRIQGKMKLKYRCVVNN